MSQVRPADLEAPRLYRVPCRALEYRSLDRPLAISSLTEPAGAGAECRLIEFRQGGGHGPTTAASLARRDSARSGAVWRPLSTASCISPAAGARRPSPALRPTASPTSSAWRLCVEVARRRHDLAQRVRSIIRGRISRRDRGVRLQSAGGAMNGPGSTESCRYWCRLLRRHKEIGGSHRSAAMRIRLRGSAGCSRNASMTRLTRIGRLRGASPSTSRTVASTSPIASPKTA